LPSFKSRFIPLPAAESEQQQRISSKNNTMARRIGTRGATSGAFDNMSFSQVAASAAVEPPDIILAEEELEMTQHDPACNQFFHQTESSSEEDSDDEEEREIASSLTQDAASSLLGLFNAAPPPPPTEQQQENILPPVADRNALFAESSLAEEEIALASNTDRGKNTKKYDESKLAVERRFFDTLSTYGGKSMQPLLAMVDIDYGNGKVQDYSFYQLIGGDKTPDKTKYLEAALILCAVKWKCIRGPNKDKPLQPNSFEKEIQKLFYVFLGKGIQYNYKKDFNSRGGFHGVIIQKWTNIRKTDALFGTNAKKTQPDMQYLDKIVESIRSGVIDLNSPEDLRSMALFILGYYCGMRGSQEHTDLAMAMVVSGEYTLEDGGEDLAGLHYIGISIPFHKARQLQLGKTSLPSDAMRVHSVAKDPTNDVFCPWAILNKYFSHCHPNALKVYAKIATKAQRKQFNDAHPGKDVWYCPSGTSTTNWGRNQVAKCFTALAARVGCKNPEKMTGHCLRVLIINKMKVNSVSGLEIAQAVRHSSINSQGNYNRETTAATQVNKQLALRPTIGVRKNIAGSTNHSMMPPPSPRKPLPMVPYNPHHGVAAAPGSDAAMAMELAKQQAKIKQLESELEERKSKKKKKKKKISYRGHLPPQFYTGYPPQQQQYPPPMYPPFGGYNMPMPYHHGGGFNPFAGGFSHPPPPFAGGYHPQQQYEEESDDESSTSSPAKPPHFPPYYFPPCP